MLEKIARMLLALIQRCSLPTIRWWGRRLGILAYYLAGSRRRVAHANLDLAYGDSLSRKEKIRIAKGSFVNLVTTALEFCYSPAIKCPILDLIHDDDGNDKKLRRAIEAWKGTIVIVPHMGNWDVVARYYRENGYPFQAVSRTQKQEWVARIVKEIRQINGANEIDKKNALRPVLAALRRGEVVGMLIDQYAHKDSVEVVFFGHKTRTTASVALLAQRTGCTLIVTGFCRLPDGSWSTDFTEPFYATVTGNTEQDLITNTQMITDKIEAIVRRHPQDWMWMHRRWRIVDKKGRLLSEEPSVSLDKGTAQEASL